MCEGFSFLPQHLYARLKSLFSRWGTQITESWSHLHDLETVEGKLEITSATLYSAKGAHPQQSFWTLSVQSNHLGNIVDVQIPCCICRGIWIYLQESEFLTNPGNSEADVHFEDCFSIGINKIPVNKYPPIHPCPSSCTCVHGRVSVIVFTLRGEKNWLATWYLSVS